MKELNDDEWLRLVRVVKNGISEKEDADFELWLNSDTSHKEIYRKVKNDWERTGNLQIQNHPNPNEIWGKITKSINSTGKSGRVISINRRWIRFAAAAAILIMGTIWLVPEFTNTKIQTLKSSIQTFVSPHDNISSFILSDGSKIWLDKGARLQYQNFDEEEMRKVILTGRGYFEIARDETKPFQIKVGNAQVEVLGTAFNINAQNSDKISVNVTHGKVAFGDKKEQVILKKGENGQLDVISQELSKSQNTNPNFLSWMTGILVFEDRTILEVCEVLKDHYNFGVSADLNLDPAIRLTATFDNQSLDEVVEIIAPTLDLSIEETEGAFRFQLIDLKQNSNNIINEK